MDTRRALKITTRSVRPFLAISTPRRISLLSARAGVDRADLPSTLEADRVRGFLYSYHHALVQKCADGVGMEYRALGRARASRRLSSVPEFGHERKQTRSPTR